MYKRLADTNVTVIGLGLMGGSLAMGLKGRAARLIGVDKNSDIVEQATRRGIVDFATEDIAHGLQEADLVILATPVQVIIKLLAHLPGYRPDGCRVLDIGSTKRLIGAAMDALPAQFEAIGGHPMCGRETSGLDAATPTLYRDANFVLCRGHRTGQPVEQLVLEVVETLGAKSIFLAADEHDALVGATSHLPYMVAALLMHQVAALAQADDRVWGVSASGLRDTSRLAGSDPGMMRDILLTNREEVISQLLSYQALIKDFLELIKLDDESALLDWLKTAKEGYLQHRQRL